MKITKNIFVEDVENPVQTAYTNKTTMGIYISMHMIDAWQITNCY